MNIIQWFKKDYKRNREALNLFIGRRVPLLVHLVWYLAWLPIVIWFIPIAYYWEEYYIPRKIKELSEKRSLF